MNEHTEERGHVAWLLVTLPIALVAIVIVYQSFPLIFAGQGWLNSAVFGLLSLLFGQIYIKCITVESNEAHLWLIFNFVLRIVLLFLAQFMSGLLLFLAILAIIIYWESK